MYLVTISRNQWKTVPEKKSQKNGSITLVFRKNRSWIWQKTVQSVYQQWCLTSQHSSCHEPKVTAGCYPGWMCQLRFPRTVCWNSKRYCFHNRVFCTYCYGSCLWTSQSRPWCAWSMGKCLWYPRILDSSVKLMDGKSPLKTSLPNPLKSIGDQNNKNHCRVVKGTVIQSTARS